MFLEPEEILTQGRQTAITLTPGGKMKVGSVAALTGLAIRLCRKIIFAWITDRY
jgi:hypothetical protein